MAIDATAGVASFTCAAAAGGLGSSGTAASQTLTVSGDESHAVCTATANGGNVTQAGATVRIDAAAPETAMQAQIGRNGMPDGDTGRTAGNAAEYEGRDNRTRIQRAHSEPIVQT